ncbi:hypothetical protein JGU66_26725 [Myxococcaceae bacterium JPH2]|nr:hypothetical protein [Myxococcaceae bacterium JPH2]
MRSGFIAVVLSMGLFAVGCGPSEAELTPDEPLSSTTQQLPMCTANGTCGSGWTCVDGGCRPICHAGVCGSPWTVCCLGGFNSNGSLTEPYCVNSTNLCKWGTWTPGGVE